LEEAIVNAYYHGNLELAANGAPDRKRSEELARQRCAVAPFCDRRIHVRARITRSEATFVIRDEGPGFDTARIQPPPGFAHADQGFGRGIMLMRSIMDEVTYNAAGNEVTMVKHGVRLDAND